MHVLSDGTAWTSTTIPVSARYPRSVQWEFADRELAAEAPQFSVGATSPRRSTAERTLRIVRRILPSTRSELRAAGAPLSREAV